MFQDIEDLFKMKEQTELDVAGLKRDADAETKLYEKNGREIEDRIRALQTEKWNLDSEHREAQRVFDYQNKELNENLYNERSYFMRRIAMASIKRIVPAKFSTKDFDAEYDFQKAPLYIEVLHATPLLALVATCFDISEKYASSNRTNKVQLFVNVVAADGFGYGRGDDRGIYALAGFDLTYNNPGGYHNISFEAPRLYENRYKNLDEAVAFVGRNKGRWLKEAAEKMDTFAKEVSEAPEFEDVFDFRLLWGSLDSTYYVESARKHQLSLKRTLNWHTEETKEFLVRFDDMPGDVGFTVDFADPEDTYRIMRNLMEAFKLRHLSAEVSELSRLADQWKQNEEKKKKAQQAAC